MLKKNFLAPVETTAKADTTAALAAPSMSGQSHTAQPSTTLVDVEPVAGAVGGHPVSPTHDDAVFREKLKHMGKSKCNGWSSRCLKNLKMGVNKMKGFGFFTVQHMITIMYESCINGHPPTKHIL